MRWDEADGLTGRPDARVRGVLESWRAGLLDLTASNPLIHADPWGPGVVAIDSPSPRGVLEALQQGRECGFLGVEEQEEGPRPRTASVFQTHMTDAEMDATLRSLRRTDHRDQLEYGMSALYLALGTLHWKDDEQEYASPILLIPVDLVDSDPLDYPRLRARPDDPLVNPALAVRLRSHGVELPAVEGLTGLDVTVFWARLDAAIGDHPEWRTDEAILLSRFTVHREVVYHDLVDNERQILAHPVVRALATEARSQIDAFKFEPITARRIDDVASPDDIPLVLDADAAQRSCVAAALAGRSFVMRGAPGTGKSQTVANMIAALIHAGKRVLLVSEKAASLDVVKDRLAHAGLDDYLLELHSDQTGRDHVASTLAAALDFIPLPPPSLSTDERQELRDHRERLNAYAEAMNEVREPLGHRLHDVLGMCAQMTDVPAAPVPPVLPIPLTTQSLQKVRDAAERLGRAWRPAVQGDAFLWRDVVDRNRLDARLHQAQTALENLVEAAGADPLAAAFRARHLADAIALTTLIGHAARRPPEAADEWLTLDSLEPVARAAEGLLRHLKSLHQAEDAVRSRAGVTWSALPTPGKLPVVPSLVHLDPPAVELLPLTAAQARGLARRFADDADRLEQHQHSLDRVTARLGLPNVVAFSDIGRVADIVDLLSRADKPEAGWFDAAGMAAAHTATRMLQRAVEVVKTAEAKAREHFNDSALAHPVDELADRFASVHKGLRKLRAPYRRDKKAAAEIARPDVKRKQAVANLAAAAAWKKALAELDETEREYGRILGRHWQRLDTDFDAIRNALGTAEEVMRVTPPEALPAVIERVSAPTPNSAIIRIVSEARKEFDRWTAALRPPPEPAPRPQLAAGPVHDAVTWLRAHVEPLTATAELVQAYSVAAGRDFTLAESAAVGLLRETAADAAAALAANATEYARVLGNAYRGTQTDVEALATAMAWTSEARRIRVGVDTALTIEQVDALGRSRPTDPLPSRVAEWQAARDWILRAFAPRRHAQLTTALDDYDHARQLLQALLEDGRGQQEWFDHQAARTILADHGLDAAVDFCAREDLAVEQILPVLGRALFQSWADTVIREDDRLPPLDAVARDRLVEEFRVWDARLQRAASADVMNAVDEKQPSGTAAAEAALLRASAAQQGRKLPVSELIGRTRHATLAVKPCFLTVPADVSRLVPADLTFDVVIIDEASRVPVPDAVTCIYRGASFVVVGDDRQLTALPTPGEGRSVLDLAISCAAFPVLDLTTHYRSRHESLIAFANHTFYQGTLSTFPPAGPAGPDTGVQLFPAIAENGDAGIADLVAGRVAHHFVTRPELSLGVIASTPDLAMRIEAAVADMVVPPDDDRLRGFFVKDLETVQGDERDVILLAIGADLGGLTGPDGWRRLNVASTRAARRVEVISTIRGRDLPDTEELRPLAAYLDYATRGEAALGLDDSRPEVQTPFEDSVRDVIRAWGYRVRTRVGTGAFRIDLAVRRSARRNAPFALGIECDGTSYDSAPAARDRDRLREQVLESLGWTLHRIWGTAWYLDREHEEQRLRAAIEDALAEFPPEEQAAELDGSAMPATAEEEQREPITLVQTEDGYATAEPEPEREPEPEVIQAAETVEPETPEEIAEPEEEVVPVDALGALDDENDAYLTGVDEADAYVTGVDEADAYVTGVDEADAYLAGVDDVQEHIVEEWAAEAVPAEEVSEEPETWAAASASPDADVAAPGVSEEEHEPRVRTAIFERVTRTEIEEIEEEGPRVTAAVFERVTRTERVEDLEEPRVRPAVFERVTRTGEAEEFDQFEEFDEPRVVRATFERLSRADVERAEAERVEAVRAATAAVEGLPIAEPVFVSPEFTTEAPPVPKRTRAKPAKKTAPKATPSTAPKAAPSHGPEEWAQPYRKARLTALPDGANLAAPDTTRRISDAIRRIAAVEGPVHISIALQRMREEWAITRITKPARAAIDAAITKLAAKGDVTWADDFLGDPGQLVPAVRLRAEGVARKADQIADAELRVAMEHLVADAGAIDVDGLLAATGRLYGWASRRSTDLDARLTALIADLVAEGRLHRRADGLSAAHGLPDPLTLPRHDTASTPSRKVRS
jgi:very-short-patch-repair endonuclease